MKGGVYVYRALKPGARFRIPFLSWHFAYVGETTSFYHRHQQHIYGLSSFGASTPKSWSDRSPYVVLRIPLPPWKWLLRSVETAVILLTWPAYNVQKNRWNPRRIPPLVAKKQRQHRDLHHTPLNLRPLHGWLLLAALLLIAWMVLK